MPTIASKYIDGKNGLEFSDYVVTNPTGHGIQVIRSEDTFLHDLIVQNCLMSGIRDFATRTIMERLMVSNNGKDNQPYNGDGILIQSLGARLFDSEIIGNGNDTTFEHGIYAASVAKDYHIKNVIVRNNAASGAKLSGGGLCEYLTSTGSPRGVVFADDVPLSVRLQNSKIAGTIYAITVTMNCNLARYSSDYNQYAPGSRFNLKGKNLNLADWKKATGLDTHSWEEAF